MIGSSSKPRFCCPNWKSRFAVLNRSDFVPMGHLAVTGDIFTCHRTGAKVLLASSGWMPGMLLNILQWAGQPLNKDLPETSIVPGVTNPDLDWNYTTPRMPRATSRLLSPEDLSSSRWTWYFYSGTTVITQNHREPSFFSFASEILSTQSISPRILFHIRTFLTTNMVWIAECYCYYSCIWYSKSF